jgi:hypothetical protein
MDTSQPLAPRSGRFLLVRLTLRQLSRLSRLSLASHPLFPEGGGPPKRVGPEG